MAASTADQVVELSINADGDGLGQASAWLDASGLKLHVPQEQIRRLDLCLNELIANIIAHGGPSARGSAVELQFQVSGQPGTNEAHLVVSDAGSAFDPLVYKSKPRPKSLDEAVPGGLGLMMMHEFSDKLSYQYREGRNQTTFSVHWDAES